MTFFRTHRHPVASHSARSVLATNLINAALATVMVGAAAVYVTTSVREAELEGLNREYAIGKDEYAHHLIERRAAEVADAERIAAFKTNLAVLKKTPGTDTTAQFAAAKKLGFSVIAAEQSELRLKGVDRRWEMRIVGCNRALGAWSNAASALFRARCRGVVDLPLAGSETEPQSRLSALGSAYYAVRNPVIEFFGYKPGALEY